jgi:esterase/lipase superfamily enzyme
MNVYSQGISKAVRVTAVTLIASALLFCCPTARSAAPVVSTTPSEPSSAADPGVMIRGHRPVDESWLVPIDLITGDAQLSPDSALRASEIKGYRFLTSATPAVIELHPAEEEHGTLGTLGITPQVRTEKVNRILDQTTSLTRDPLRRNFEIRTSPDAIKGFGPNVSVAKILFSVEQPYSLTKVFYATDRASYGMTPIRAFYNSDERDRLDYGLATMRIDDNLQPPEDGVFAWVTRWFNRDKPPPTAEALTNTRTGDFEKFASQIRDSLVSTQTDEVLVYVHGFRTSFDDDTRDAIILGYLTKFPGPVIAYSWPSRGKLADYDADYESADRTIPRLGKFLQQLKAIRGVHKIHVVAHSMGSRVLFWAMERNPKLQLGEVVMVAGDTSIEDYKQYFNVIRSNATRFTLYSTKADIALYASSQLHDVKRIGFWYGDNAPFTLQGIDSVDATNAVQDIISHGYFLNSDLPKTDIIYALRSQPAAKRGCLQQQTGEPVYYFYKCR